MLERLEKLIFSEEDFPKVLENTIKPWLLENLQEGYLTSEDGKKIHYYYVLHPEEKASIVISHGFCEFVSKYHEVMYMFYEMGYSVFLAEYRGFGFSERAVEELDKVYVESYDEYVCDLHSFTEQIVKEKSLSKKYYLFAHSMGGCIGTLFLEEYPDFFEKAILSSPLLQMNFKEVPEWAVNTMLFWAKLTNKWKDYVPGQKGFDHKPVFENSSCLSESRYHYVFSEREREPHYSTYGGTYAWSNASVQGIKKAHKNAGKIQIPVLLFQAGRDSMVKPGGQLRFVEETKNTKFVLFEESKHEVFNALEDTRRRYFEEVFSFFD